MTASLIDRGAPVCYVLAIGSNVFGIVALVPDLLSTIARDLWFWCVLLDFSL